MDDFIPVSNPKASYESHKNEIDNMIQKVLSSGWYILGEQVKEFEKKFAEYLGARFCVGVASGTDALAIALKAVGVCPGDEVITVSFTAVATIAAIEQIGAVPVFIDINEHTFCMDDWRVEDAITEKTKVVVPVHIYGYPAPVTQIMKILKDTKIKVVEDCAQAVGTILKGKHTGTWSHAASFSFYPTKNLGAIGDGGAIVTNDKNVAMIAKQLREYGWDENRVCRRVGINSRMDEMQAGILNVKLPGISKDVRRRKEIASRYLEVLNGEQIVTRRKVGRDDAASYCLFVVKAKERFHLQKFLVNRNIGTSFHYPLPVHLQSIYKGRIKGSADLPNTETVNNQILSLPMYPELTDEQVNRICLALREWIAISSLTWEDILGKDIVQLYAGDFPSLSIEYNQDFIGLSLKVINGHTTIEQDITKVMPIPDNSIDIYQSEDVFEHIECDKLIFVMNEIYRVLKLGGLFRLSVPDYKYDVYEKRAVKDKDGKIIFDIFGGGNEKNPGHKWFPTIESIKQLIEQTNFRNSSIEFLHYYDENGEPVINKIDYSKGFISRTPDNQWQEGSYRPISLVVDFVR